jgi:cardiolipin synthase
MRRFVDTEIESSLRITPHSHRADRTWFNRLKWGLAYFFVAVADYNLSRRLNFGLDGK